MRIRVHPLGLTAILALAGCHPQTLDAGSTGSSGGGGAPSDPEMIASGIPEAPLVMASDGTTLYWVDGANGYLRSMSVAGGSIGTLSSTASRGFTGDLYVDTANVYVLQDSLVAIPKDGGSPFNVSDGEDGGDLQIATIVGPTAYWMTTYGNVPITTFVESASVSGGKVAVVAQIEGAPDWLGIAIAAGDVFLAGQTGLLHFFPLADAPEDGGASQIDQTADCAVALLSGTDGAYCIPNAGSITRVVGDGGVSTLATGYSARSGALDGTYLYWSDTPDTGGTVKKVPRVGGPSVVVATVGSSPEEYATAVAVDDSAVYWATSNGQIWRVAK